MERLGTAGAGAAPTMVEQKIGYSESSAEATVLERQMERPAAKKSNAMLIAIAAVVVLTIIGGAVWMLRSGPETAPVATTTVAPGTEVTATAPTQAAIPGGQGILLLSAAPWGDLEKIVASDQKEVILSEDVRSTPAAIALKPGRYTVTQNGPSGRKSVDVEIEAGRRTPENVDMGKVDVDALTEEMTKP
jgi:hypothetical protein